MTELSGKRARVTGAGSGIGRAIAIDLAKHGAEVLLVGRRRSPLEETAAAVSSVGGQAIVDTADLTEPDQIERFAERVLARWPAVDIVINNAGFSSRIRSARFIGPEEWRAVMDVNTMGPAMLTRRLLPAMIDRGCGDVVMIASVAGLNPNVMAGVAYSAAKAAARAYMAVLASEVRGFGIRCITIFPGEVDTPILDNRALPPGAAERATMMMPEDIAAAVTMAVSLPGRTMASEITLVATHARDLSADMAAAREKQERQASD